MYKIKTLAILALLMIPFLHYGQHTDEINSNRPGETIVRFCRGKISHPSGIWRLWHQGKPQYFEL